ncbi:MAG: hypothetical protein JWP01_685 [Myxococcales bacterium]|nr:hypothetical protein [Myxococcales bacterium]
MLAVLAICGVASAKDTASIDAISPLTPPCDPARAYCFAVQLHVAQTADGLVVPPAWIANQLAIANQHFAPLDVGFQIAGVQVAPPGTEHVRTRAQRNALGSAVTGRVIHVFVTAQLENVDQSTTPVFGVAWRVKQRKIIILSAKSWDRTLAHELGHVFGLPHSTYPISIMNKTPREEPARETRTFADEEVAAMGPGMKRLLRSKVIENLARRRD